MKILRLFILLFVLPFCGYSQLFRPIYLNGENLVVMDLGTAFKVADSTIALKQLREYVSELEPHVASLQNKLNLCIELDHSSQNLIASQEAVISADKKVIGLSAIAAEQLREENKAQKKRIAKLEVKSTLLGTLAIGLGVFGLINWINH